MNVIISIIILILLLLVLLMLFTITLSTVAGTYIPRKEVEIIETIRATVIQPNQAIRLRARKETRVNHSNWVFFPNQKQIILPEVLRNGTFSFIHTCILLQLLYMVLYSVLFTNKSE